MFLHKNALHRCDNNNKYHCHSGEFTYCKVKWKLRTCQPFWYNGFTTNPSTSQKGDRFSWWNYTSSAAQSATTIKTFIAMAKTLMDIRSISAGVAIINLHPNARGRKGQIVGGIIRLALRAERPAFCTTIICTTPITVAVISAAAIRFSFLRQILLLRLPCRNCSAKPILNAWGIRYFLLLPLSPCFTSAKTLFATSAWFCEPHSTSRFLMWPLLTGVPALLRCLTTCDWNSCPCLISTLTSGIPTKRRWRLQGSSITFGLS